MHRNKQPAKLILGSKSYMSWPVASPGSLFSCLKMEKNKTFFQHFRLFEFSLKYGKRESWILDMFFIEIFWCTDQKILIGQHGAKSILAPGVKALKMRFLPVSRVKNPEIQKFLFLQISKFLGPIGGTNNIFFVRCTISVL